MILKQFDGAAVAPRDDAILYNAIIKKNGVFSGVEITHIGSNQLHITAGHGILKGRVWEQEEETIHCNLASSGTLKGRAYIHMDLTDMDTPIKIMTIAAASLPELIQDENCNYTNGIYEMELCTYNVTDLAISNLEVTYNNISGILPIIEKMTDLAALTEKGYVADALLVAELNKNIQNVNVYVDNEGKLHFVDSVGADAVLNFSSTKVIFLGSGTSFDVSSYDGYENFTTDNFITEIDYTTSYSGSGTSNSTVSGSWSSSDTDYAYVYAWAIKNKSYDASTGVLTANEVIGVRGTSTNNSLAYKSVTKPVKAYLVIGDIS